MCEGLTAATSFRHVCEEQCWCIRASSSSLNPPCVNCALDVVLHAYWNHIPALNTFKDAVRLSVKPHLHTPATLRAFHSVHPPSQRSVGKSQSKHTNAPSTSMRVLHPHSGHTRVSLMRRRVEARVFRALLIAAISLQNYYSYNEGRYEP